MKLLQIAGTGGTTRVVAVADDGVQGHEVDGAVGVYELARRAADTGQTLAAVVDECGRGGTVDVRAALEAGRVAAPVAHPDPAHMLVTGTGLTHTGSADGRDLMHRVTADDADTLTDSMRMFRRGVEGGRPAPGTMGVQPEWFYKGDGTIVAGPGEALVSPDFALDGGEEPEIAGIYIIAADGTPCRLGYVLANEFSDHVTERENYLYLAHSKLRACALGGELLLGDLPASVRGVSRIRRDGEVLWERPFVTGEEHMCHSIANLEAHHFKYAAFRRPGDLHVHFLGTATLSFSDGVSTRDGDIFELEAGPFALPLRNPMTVAEAPVPAVRAL
ncbi:MULTISPECIES: AraD1 family protein [Arhodomonas]|uniref:AraD1 family protein n=1 Tax=Arhodomonas TaxID=2368 RepID=UPI00036CBAA3|nr:AraD1 family protein [Arhodomonas aquaeolei]